MVEVLNSPKPVVACSVVTSENMHIYINSPFALKVRESNMEFLLLNHPLDCAICDQGGECDLQNRSMIYGNDFSRSFFQLKKVKENKATGPLLKTVLIRCINCSKCVRVLQEISMFYFFGMVGRGNAAAISTYSPEFVKNELSGNSLDYCPVNTITCGFTPILPTTHHY